jgi:hypothetical protein
MTHSNQVAQVMTTFLNYDYCCFDTGTAGPTDGSEQGTNGSLWRPPPPSHEVGCFWGSGGDRLVSSLVM